MASRQARIAALAIVLAILVSAVPASSYPLTAVGDVLFNGGFERGFQAKDACGMVGNGWECFHNNGTASFGFHDDTWQPVVFADEHSQLIEISTKQMGGDADRNAGIYQTALVVPGQVYELALKGMIRSEDGGGDPWRYRVYVGFDYHGGTRWQDVTDWRELPWDTYYNVSSPGSFSSYYTRVTPSTNRLTVFVRLQRKWGTWYEVTYLNVDAISLQGPMARPPAAPGAQPGPKPEQPPMAPRPPQPPAVRPPHPTPKPPPETTMPGDSSALVCDGPNLLRNGNFEHGFQPNGEANYWVGFNNGGRANYGFYDDMWDPVVSEGEHSLLVEINTLDVGNATDENRMAGIYQRVHLRPGATYELSLDAMMRERNDHSDEDFYRYMVLWGLSKNGGTDPAQMDKTEMVALDNIYLREAPGPMQSYSARFTAPSQVTTVWLYALKKWATLERELDVNLDNVQLRQCRRPAQKPVRPMPPVQKPVRPKPPQNPDVCALKHVVEPGDTLFRLAQVYDTSVAAILAHNKIADPNRIYVGQVLCIPVSSARPDASWMAASPPAAPANAMPQPDYAAPSTPVAPTPPPVQAGSTYEVQPGDTLSAIAERVGTTIEALVALNGLSTPHILYVGQVLLLPGNAS